MSPSLNCLLGRLLFVELMESETPLKFAIFSESGLAVFARILNCTLCRKGCPEKAISEALDPAGRSSQLLTADNYWHPPCLGAFRLRCIVPVQIVAITSANRCRVERQCHNWCIGPWRSSLLVECIQLAEGAGRLQETNAIHAVPTYRSLRCDGLSYDVSIMK